MTAKTSEAHLLTIGHSTLEINAFIALLKEFSVSAVADVRSSPYSRFSPQYNTDALRRSLLDNRIQYVFLGEELGARRNEPECYVDDVAKYDLIAETEAFARGIQRLRTGLATQRISLLCAEKDPLTCHRMILVCRHLRDDVPISHIIGPNDCENQEQAESRLLKLVGLPDRDLFRSRADLLDEAYSKQGDQIAYRRESMAGTSSTEGD
ncbi:MAG: DUF488 domain-containing protein [Verrucomicrobia bacterium]|nr:DUF488 domain-containing protein [Verrucomicrobiota bacterium]